ncbi:MAG TPA: EAL domain-containing protein [Armatimonadota bacterium]|nr:EAL domain-containing protein [Armatimonadota bacterium]
MRVLIAEDDSVSRRLLEVLLAKWGYEVVVARDGQEAFNILESSDAPHLAVLDWMMPVMDGVQVCREIRKRRVEPYTYVILLTAKSGKQDVIEGLDAGADDYITKPFDTSELQVRLRAGRRIVELQNELLSIREALREQATHDPLTRLPNRLLFGDRLSQGLARARRQGKLLAIMFLDLDRFKIINDTLGHSAGDILLTHVAKRLTTVLRDVDTIARMGGDEFTIIISEIDSPDEVSIIAEKVLKSFPEPFYVNDQEVFVSPSIGISLFPTDGADAETLVKNADTAMYRAKDFGRNTYQFYAHLPNTTGIEQVSLDRDLRKAIEQQQLMPYYQARVDLRTNEVLGAEALVRWKHPGLGLLSPAHFIPLAEETGLIVPLSNWMLRTVCAQNVAWQKQGLEPMDIAVNISARHFLHSDLVESVSTALDETGLDPCYLGLELTESTLMHNPDTAAAALQKLKDMGVKISIDDFGTGYSSLSYLKKFPVDAVKIDQSFIKDITTNPDDAAIAGAVIAMAHSLKLKVIAEGVETLEQLEFLKSINCDEMQGYFISRPVPAEDFQQLLWTQRNSVLSSSLFAA